jgi:hypothetical protein
MAATSSKHLAPALLLPDAVAPLAKGDAVSEFGGIAGERADQRRRRAVCRNRPLPAPGLDTERRHHAAPA